MQSSLNFQISSNSKDQSILQQLSTAVTLAVTLGLVWIFGYFMMLSSNPQFLLIMSWIFTIASSLQVRSCANLTKLLFRLFFMFNSFVNMIYLNKIDFTIFQGICIFILVCFRQSDVKRIWWARMQDFSSRFTSESPKSPTRSTFTSNSGKI